MSTLSFLTSLHFRHQKYHVSVFPILLPASNEDLGPPVVSLLEASTLVFMIWCLQFFQGHR